MSRNPNYRLLQRNIAYNKCLKMKKVYRIKDLILLCKEKGIKGYSHLKKEDLIEYIEEHEKRKIQNIIFETRRNMPLVIIQLIVNCLSVWEHPDELRIQEIQHCRQAYRTWERLPSNKREILTNLSCRRTLCTTRILKDTLTMWFAATMEWDKRIMNHLTEMTLLELSRLFIAHWEKIQILAPDPKFLVAGDCKLWLQYLLYYHRNRPLQQFLEESKRLKDIYPGTWVGVVDDVLRC